jgi:DNA uptake protein ComE-like DNA-binding protein
MSVVHSRFGFVVAACLLAAGWTSSAQAQVGKPIDPPLLEVNTASEADLAKAPGLTAEIAKELVAKRPIMTLKDLNDFLASKMLSADQIKEVHKRVFLHLNLNTATDEEIMMVPGMTAQMVREFKEYRPYDGIEKFRREMAKYVDEAEVKRLEQYVFVPININTASDEVLNTIPGFSSRMLREFKEYRPYDNIEKFRREIGKYVDEKEVARLERYITLGAAAAPARGDGARGARGARGGAPRGNAAPATPAPAPARGQ